MPNLNKIVFLDIDGPLVTMESLWAGKKAGEGDCERARADQDCIRRLNEIIEATDCAIVHCSAWRVNEALVAFKRWGLNIDEERVIGWTEHWVYGKVENVRQAEITDWLTKNAWKIPLNFKFVVIEDAHPTKHHWIESHWIQCDGYNGGLTEEGKKKAIRILNEV